ncbi:MAG: biotin carboxylase N-terminal domain-containing protein, partial [Xanthobacteraceae bacterium]
MTSLLIANRGEIARRIMRTAKRMGLRRVAVYSDADAQALHVREADTALRIGGAAPRDSYLNIAAIIDAAKRTGADAVHPGYGFLAENADFAQAVIDARLTWVGPPPAVIRQMGDKAEAKRIAREAGVPTIPGAEPQDQSNAGLIAAAKPLGLPLMIKAAAGGGGRGMRQAHNDVSLVQGFNAARVEAEKAFNNGALYL